MSPERSAVSSDRYKRRLSRYAPGSAGRKTSTEAIRLGPISTRSCHRFRADIDVATAIFGHLTGAAPDKFSG